MTSDRILGAGVYRLLAEGYRADIAEQKARVATDDTDQVTYATNIRTLATHAAIAEAVMSAAPTRRRRTWWHWPARSGRSTR